MVQVCRLIVDDGTGPWEGVLLELFHINGDLFTPEPVQGIGVYQQNP